MLIAHVKLSHDMVLYSTMASLFVADNVFKIYGKGEASFEALKGLSLVLHKGESIAIIGKSGSGKSTLMHLLAGLDKPTRGTLSFSGQDMAQLSEKELSSLRNAQFGFVFQQFFLQPRLSVLENVTLPLKIAGMSPRERHKRGMDVLAAVHLTDKAKSLAVDLSGGQKQRASIARAIIGEPSVVFADEPTGNLDTENGDAVVRLLFDLQKNKHITLVMVTHDPELALQCDRHMTIKDGEIALDSYEDKEKS